MWVHKHRKHVHPFGFARFSIEIEELMIWLSIEISISHSLYKYMFSKQALVSHDPVS